MLTWVVLLAFGKPIPEAGYVQARNGHLYLGEKRLRFWGVHLAPGLSVQPYQVSRRLVRRIRAMGFNAVCIWGARELFRNGVPDSRKGSGSAMDRLDYLVWRCKEERVFVWLATLCRLPQVHREHYYLLPSEGAEDERAWWEAVNWTQTHPRAVRYFARIPWYIDERLQALRCKFIADLLNHYNPYTDKRYAEEECVAMLYLHDETGFPLNVAWGVPRREELCHPYFREKLRRLWNEWLRKEYDTTQKLKEAWGQLLQGESLEEGSVSVTGLHKEPKARRNLDLSRFLFGLVERYHQKLLTTIRRLAPKGVGSNVIPVATDTSGYLRLWAIYPALHGGVAGVGGYFHWSRKSSLDNPLRFLRDRDGSGFEVRLANVPQVIYTTNQSALTEYRAEFPIRVATWASWQDFDGVFFYHWVLSLPNEQYTRVPIYEKKRRGTHDLSGDEIYLSQMRTASTLFLRGYLKPPPSRLTFVVGRKALGSFHFGVQWWRTEHYDHYWRTAVKRGARLLIDPNWDGWTRPEGGKPEAGGSVPIPVSPGWKCQPEKKRFIIDLPEIKVFLGFINEGETLKFSHDVQVRKLNRSFICLALASEDGLPVDSSKHLLLSVVSKARNRGLTFDDDGRLTNEGGGPPEVERVSCELLLPTLTGRKCRKLDFALRTISVQDASKKVVLKELEPVFLCKLTKD